MASSQYSVVSTYQLMENHISAAVIDEAKNFSAHTTPSGATLLLSLGSDHILRASVESSNTSNTGWVVTDISPLLSTQYDSGYTLSAQHFAASGSVLQGSFAILLSIEAVLGTVSRNDLWLLTGPPGIDASSWLVGGKNIVWTKLGYDAASTAATQSISAENLTITGIFLEHGVESNDPTIAIATVADPVQAGELRCFLLNLATNAKPTWSYYPQEQDIGTAGLSMVPGKISSSSFWGLYKLYQLNGNQSLSFLPTQGSYGPPDAILYTVPSGATAIASLTYQPSGPVSYTDLFVAAGGYIAYFPYNQGKPHTGIQLISSALVDQVTELHVVECGGQVVLWALNRSGNLFYSTVPLADRANPAVWQTPIVLLSNTTAIAALSGGTADSISLFAVSPLASTTASGQSGNGLIQLSRNPTTGTWLNSVHPLPSTTDCITLKTYTTRILVTDSNHVPQPNMEVTAAVSADCALIINGIMQTVATTNILDMKCDSGGYLNFIHAVSSLSTPSLTLALPDGTKTTIDPTGEVVNTISGITDPIQITNATYVDAAGNTQNLVTPGTNADAISGVTAGLKLITTKIPQLPRASTCMAGSRRSALSMEKTEDGSLWTDLGDLVQWIAHAVESVVNAAFEVVDDVIHFVVAVAEDVFRAVVNTVEDALHAITALFKWIGAEIESIFRWLGFLFDWGDFIKVKGSLKGMIKQSLTSFATIQGQTQSAGDAWFAHAKDSILPKLSSMPMAKPTDQPLNAAWSKNQPPPKPVGADKSDLRTDPKLGWLKDRVNTPPSTATGRSDSAVTSSDNPSPADALMTAINTFIQDVLQTFETVFEDIDKLVTGDMSASDFFSSFIAQIEILGLDALQVVFDALMSAVSAITSGIQDAFDMPLDIPILSALYRFVTGSDLTLLDVICLVSGIGITLVYKITTGKSPVEVIASASDTSAVNSAITNLLVLPSQSSVQNKQQPAVTTKSKEIITTFAPTDNEPKENDGIEQLTGALLIFQAFSLLVDGAAEIADAKPVSNVAMVVDCTARLTRLILELVNGNDETQVKMETGWTSLVQMVAVWGLWHEGLDSEVVEQVSLLDANMSLVWGIWHLVHISDITGEGGDCPVGLTGEAVIELLEPVQAGAALSKQPEAALVLVGIRSISAIVAGATRAFA